MPLKSYGVKAIVMDLASSLYKKDRKPILIEQLSR